MLTKCDFVIAGYEVLIVKAPVKFSMQWSWNSKQNVVSSRTPFNSVAFIHSMG